MTHASIPQVQRATYDSAAALTMYRFELELELLKLTLPEMVALGEVETSSALIERWELSIDSPAFKELINDAPRFRRMGELFFELVTKKYQDGVSESAAKLRTAEWARRAWGRAPAMAADALRSMYERLRAAAMIGSKTDIAVDNLKNQTSLKTAATGRPCNPLQPGNGNTYDSLHTATPLDVNGVKTIRTAFRTQKAINGIDYAGYELTHIEVGPDLEEMLLTLVKDDLLLVTSDIAASPDANAPMVLRPNPLKKYRPIIPVVNPYLTETGVWYAWSADASGKLPTLCVTKTPPSPGMVPGMPGATPVLGDGVEWTYIDENSDSYKLGSPTLPKGWVGVSAEVEAGFKIMSPRRFKRVEPT